MTAASFEGQNIMTRSSKCKWQSQKVYYSTSWCWTVTEVPRHKYTV